MTAGDAPLRLGIVGIGGRMGQELVACAAGDPAVTVVGGVVRSLEAKTTGQTGDLDDRPGSDPGADMESARTKGILVHTRLADLRPRIDVVLDFSTPDSTVTTVQDAADLGLPIVIGTTGLSPEQREVLRTASERIPVWYGRNTSTGIGALLAILPEISRMLSGNHYDVEIIEAHHRHKVDAPSGTALALAEAMLTGLDSDEPHPYVHGRAGRAPRTPGEIGIHAIRAGGNSGEHTVIFASEGDELRISHRAYNRRAFAAGAIRAAQAIVGREPGWYGPG